VRKILYVIGDNVIELPKDQRMRDAITA
jgi:hypothetical protein